MTDPLPPLLEDESQARQRLYNNYVQTLQNDGTVLKVPHAIVPSTELIDHQAENWSLSRLLKNRSVKIVKPPASVQPTIIESLKTKEENNENLKKRKRKNIEEGKEEQSLTKRKKIAFSTDGSNELYAFAKTKQETKKDKESDNHAAAIELIDIEGHNHTQLEQLLNDIEKLTKQIEAVTAPIIAKEREKEKEKRKNDERSRHNHSRKKKSLSFLKTEANLILKAPTLNSGFSWNLHSIAQVFEQLSQLSKINEKLFPMKTSVIVKPPSFAPKTSNFELKITDLSKLSPALSSSFGTKECNNNFSNNNNNNNNNNNDTISNTSREICNTSDTYICPRLAPCIYSVSQRQWVVNDFAKKVTRNCLKQILDNETTITKDHILCNGDRVGEFCLKYIIVTAQRRGVKASPINTPTEAIQF